DNPLCGPSGAAAVFGPQKGATPQQGELLERGLDRWASLVESRLVLALRNIPGMGASGGLPVALTAFLKARICPGASFILQRLEFDQALRSTDFLITGEGRVDSSTLHGKGPMEAIRCAHRVGVRTIVLAGSQGPGADALLNEGVDRLVTVSPMPPVNSDEARRYLLAASALLVPLLLPHRGVQSYA
ncbi:MAG: glycerate kinase, partial [Methylocella sp.]